MVENNSTSHLDLIKKQTRAGNKIVFVSGFFNIVHPGHLRLLRFAAECGDFLVVGVLGDAVGATLLEEQIRFEGIKAISLVDYALVLNTPPETFIQELQPDIVVKGKEHENSHNPESEIVQSYGGKILFGSGDISFSLVELLKDESKRIGSSTFENNDFYMQRHNFHLADLENISRDFQKLKVLVIGDVIVDEYITCDSLGMSQEDPTIVVTPVGTDLYVGGRRDCCCPCR